MVAFTKMHGLGNDFVVIDGRSAALALTPAQVRAIGDRRRGVGFDQLLVIEPAPNGDADMFLRVYNPDGSESGACGNGTRCVAALAMGDSGRDRVAIATRRGVLGAIRAGDGVTVDMGEALNGWAEVPLAEACDTLHVPGVAAGPLADPVAVGMGNPHCVFLVDDADAIADLETLGPQIEHHAMFPERTNVEVVSVGGPNRLRLRVWERGVGITEACGSGACAAAVAAARRGLAGREVAVDLDGGRLDIVWRESDGHVLMSGPVATSFTGEMAL